MEAAFEWYIGMEQELIDWQAAAPARAIELERLKFRLEAAVRRQRTVTAETRRKRTTEEAAPTAAQLRPKRHCL